MRLLDGLECARCAPLHVPAFKGNVLCEDGLRRDLCEGHHKLVQREVGRKSQVKGADFESWAEEQHEEALRLGIVAGPIEHNEPHWRRLNGRWERVAPGVSDFTGVLYDGHSSTLGVELKCYEHRLPRDEISPKQQRHLDSIVRGGGGLALLLVRITDGSESVTSAIPWQSIPWVVAKSVESVTAKEIEPWRITARCYLESFCPVRGKPAASGRRVFPRE